MKFDRKYTEDIEFIIKTINSKGLNYRRQEGKEFENLLSYLCDKHNISKTFIRRVACWEKYKGNKVRTRE